MKSIIFIIIIIAGCVLLIGWAVWKFCKLDQEAENTRTMLGNGGGE